MSSVDFVIITPLPEERDAILKKLEKFCTCKKGDPDQQDIQIYYSCDLPVNFPSGKQGAYKVVVMPLLGMGRSRASAATVNAIHRWHPRYVILVGIAGGNVERNIKLGDVLAPGQIVDYELQKLTSDGVEVRSQVYPTDQRLLGAVQNFTDRNAWQKLIITPRPDDSLPQCYHDGSVASGDKVDAVRRVFTQYKKVWSKLLGIEMEAGGVEIATIQAAHSPGFFMIRGVSDLADEEKDSEEVKKWRLYACDVAAAYTVALLRSGPVPLQTPPDANGSIIPNDDRLKNEKNINFIKGNLPGLFSLLEKRAQPTPLPTVTTFVSPPTPSREAPIRNLPSTPPRRETPQPTSSSEADPDVSEGQQLHWDRDEAMQVFVGMIKKNPKYPYHILAVQGPKEAGFESFVERLEWICDKKLSSQEILKKSHANLLLPSKIDLGSSSDFEKQDPRRMAKKIVSELIQAINYYTENHLENNEIASQQKKELKEIQGKFGKVPETELGQQLAAGIKGICKECIVILFLKKFECLSKEESGQWLVSDWLLEEASSIDNLYVVITGEIGLGALSGRKHIDYRQLPGMSIDEFRNWVKGCNLTKVTERMIENAYKRAHGDVEVCRNFIDAWKMLHE